MNGVRIRIQRCVHRAQRRDDEYYNNKNERAFYRKGYSGGVRMSEGEGECKCSCRYSILAPFDPHLLTTMTTRVCARVQSATGECRRKAITPYNIYQ